jgi:hypothetical protein
MVPKEPTRTLMSLSVERKNPLRQTAANANREEELQNKKKTKEEHTQQGMKQERPNRPQTLESIFVSRRSCGSCGQFSAGESKPSHGISWTVPIH